MNAEIIVIGAGASGLMAAYELTRQGKKVLILEARDRIGGRIFRHRPPGFTFDIESGAEFIHDRSAVTTELAKQFNLPTEEVSGPVWQYENGKLSHSADFMEGMDEVVDELRKLSEDMPITEFMEKKFPWPQHAQLKDEVFRMVSGYDAADPARTSSFAVREEWGSENMDQEKRIKNGYSPLMDCLQKEILSNGGKILLSKRVDSVHWQKGNVLINVGTEEFKSEKLIVSLPPSVLQANAVPFAPALNTLNENLPKLGFGPVIKVHFQFKDQFWKEYGRKGFSFLFSKEVFPTWWTQMPAETPVLTGWLAGSMAYPHISKTQDELLELALVSLANIFQQTPNEIKQKLVASNIANWAHEVLTMGGYSYQTVNSTEIKKRINIPVEDTIFFTGEWLNEGTDMGTVEAALRNGRSVANRLLQPGQKS